MPCARNCDVRQIVSRLFLEDVDERAADDLALLLGVVDALRARVEEARAGVDRLMRKWKRVAQEVASTRCGLVAPQDAVVDEDAGQLVADGAMRSAPRRRSSRRRRRARRRRGRRRPARGCARSRARRSSPSSSRPSPCRSRKRKFGQELGARAACARPRGGTGRRSAGARGRRRRRSASWRCGPAPSSRAASDLHAVAVAHPHRRAVP